MNSTKDKMSPEVRDFFKKKLTPLREKLRNDGKVFFDIKPAPDVETYYVKRKKTTMVPEDFEVAGCDSITDFEEALVNLWASQGNHELTHLAPTLLKLAKMFYFVEKQNEEVSPFIYVMF